MLNKYFTLIRIVGTSNENDCCQNMQVKFLSLINNSHFVTKKHEIILKIKF